MKNSALVLILIAFCSGRTASCSEPTEALFAEAPGTLLNTTVAERGWSSGWKADSELTSQLDGSFAVISGSLDSPAYRSRGLRPAGNRFEADASAQKTIWRGLSNPINWSDDSSVYISVLVQWSGNHPSVYSHLYFMLGDVQTRFGLTADGVNAHKMRVNARNTTGSDQYGTTLYDAGPVYMLVAKLELSSQGEDTIHLSLFEPETSLPVAEPASWDVSASRVREGAAGALGFDTQVYTSHTVAFDELRIGSTYESVISPPKTLSLIVITQ